MKFGLYILVAFVFAFTAALPQDVSELLKEACQGKAVCEYACALQPEVCSFCQVCDISNMSKIEELLKLACQGKEVCEYACTLQPEVCPFCQVCDLM